MARVRHTLSLRVTKGHFLPCHSQHNVSSCRRNQRFGTEYTQGRALHLCVVRAQITDTITRKICLLHRPLEHDLLPPLSLLLAVNTHTCTHAHILTRAPPPPLVNTQMTAGHPRGYMCPASPQEHYCQHPGWLSLAHTVCQPYRRGTPVWLLTLVRSYRLSRCLTLNKRGKKWRQTQDSNTHQVAHFP